MMWHQVIVLLLVVDYFAEVEAKGERLSFFVTVAASTFCQILSLGFVSYSCSTRFSWIVKRTLISAIK